MKENAADKPAQCTDLLNGRYNNDMACHRAKQRNYLGMITSVDRSVGPHCRHPAKAMGTNSDRPTNRATEQLNRSSD